MVSHGSEIETCSNFSENSVKLLHGGWKILKHGSKLKYRSEVETCNNFSEKSVKLLHGGDRKHIQVYQKS